MNEREDDAPNMCSLDGRVTSRVNRKKGDRAEGTEENCGKGCGEFGVDLSMRGVLRITWLMAVLSRDTHVHPTEGRRSRRCSALRPALRLHGGEAGSSSVYHRVVSHARHDSHEQCAAEKPACSSTATPSHITI